MRRALLGIATTVLMLTLPANASAAVDPPDPGQIKTSSYGSGAATYPYIVYIPTTYARSNPSPLVVMTHGCQTTAEEQMRSTLFNQVAEREGFIVLYPDVTADHSGQPGPLRNCWQFPLPESWTRNSGDAGALAGMTQAVMDRWPIDDERVYMIGVSAGGFMTSIMAAAYPDIYAAVGIMAAGAYADGGCLFTSPGIPVETSAQLAYEEMGERARVIPRIVMGGDADQGIMPACADKALAQGLRTNNLVLGDSQEAPISLAPATVRDVPKQGGYASTVSTYLDPGGCVIGERWLIHGMNHFWSGGTTDPEYANFTDPKGPNGAEATWGFVSQYTKSSTANQCVEAKRCTKQRLKLRVPREAKNLRATVNGRATKVRLKGRRARVRIPVDTLAPAQVVIRGRTDPGERFTRQRSFADC